jgi:hypothetical protein
MPGFIEGKRKREKKRCWGHFEDPKNYMCHERK